MKFKMKYMKLKNGKIKKIKNLKQDLKYKTKNYTCGCQ